MSKFTHEPATKREWDLQRTLRKLNKNNIFSEIEQLYDLYAKDSKTAEPKICISFTPGCIPLLRPIVFSMYTYKVVQYLGSLLSKHITSDYAKKDSFTFTEEIKQLKTWWLFNILWCHQFIYKYSPKRNY